MVVEVGAVIVVVVPLLIFAVPPLVDGLVAMLALLAQIFLALGGFMAMLAVFGNRLIEFSLGLFGIVPAFCKLIGGMKHWSAKREHQNSQSGWPESKTISARDIEVAM
ncbi:MAG TPA: hypothetical protein VMF66_17605 [Candidatus Acidoferrum sp.]|nr:hypothetical protein [Candidatus Acidoferrum sp.]